MDGIINVYKERGFTSHDVVAKLRGILKMKKIGHTGTLDPEAEGVLPVCLGKGTRLCDLLTDKDKTYEAVLLLGKTTDTQDTTGTVLKEAPVTSTEEEVREAILSFLGEGQQIPPMYSALKQNGKKLYELARAGIEVERKPREITIHEIEILEVNLPYVRFSVTCSKGTYIRTLCNDIGAKLGCGGTMDKLLRTRVERFLLEESKTLDEISQCVQNGTIEELVIPVDQMFSRYESYTVTGDEERLAENGNKLSGIPKEMLRIYNSKGQFIGLYKDGKPFKMFFGGK